MIYDIATIKQVINSYLTNHKDLGHSKLADVIHEAGRLSALSHRQLRKYIGDVRDENKSTGTGNKLIIGDLHTPFDLDEYFDFCVGLYTKYDCDSVMFIGDVIDSHASSYHESDPDGLSAGDELYWAKKRLARWHERFPYADLMIGNHDLIFARKAKSAGLSKHVLRPFEEIIACPTWKCHYDDIMLDGIVYSHGNVGDAAKKALMNRISTVQGHLHSKGYVQHFVSIKDAIFGVQTGCGIDRHKYAMAYGKPFASKPVIGAAVMLNNGTLPIVELMKL